MENEQTNDTQKNALAMSRAERRPAPISWRPPADKRAEFEELLVTSGLTANAFLTEAVFGRSRHRPAELRLLGQILGSCGQIADKVRELERTNHADAHARILDVIADGQAEIRSALFLLLSRKP